MMGLAEQSMPDSNPAAPEPGQSADTAPAPQPEAIKPEGIEQPDAPPDGEPEKKPEEVKTPKGVQKRVDELTRQRNDERRLNERLLAIVEKSVSSGSTPKTEQAPSGPPRREDFETFETYLEAKADFQVAKQVSEIGARAERQRQQQEATQREASWTQRMKEAEAKHEDFADVVFSEDLAITPVMAEAMKTSEVGQDVVYHLGKNPSEAKRIAGLDPVAQVREIGKIEAQLTNKPARQPSRAPTPIEPVGGGKTGVGDPSVMSQAEYEARRKKEGAWWASKG